MKTAEEKAQFFIEAAEHYSVNFGEWRKESKQALIKLFKEQDRDTRHACAEAVNSIALDDNAISAAHNAVMNTKAV